MIAVAVFGCGSDRVLNAPVTGPSTFTISVALGRSLIVPTRGMSRPMTWSLVQPPGHGIVDTSGRYFAPFRMPLDPVGTFTATSGDRSDTTRVEITSRDVTIEDCVGAQPPGYIYVTELPEAVQRMQPRYPDIARVLKVEGTVVVEAHVCTSGLVYETRISHSIPLLDAAAIDAVRQWAFKPASSEGQPVAVWVSVPVRFTLPPQGVALLP